VTIELTLLSMTLAVLVGVPLGVRAAAKSGASDRSPKAS